MMVLAKIGGLLALFKIGLFLKMMHRIHLEKKLALTTRERRYALKKESLSSSYLSTESVVVKDRHVLNASSLP